MKYVETRIKVTLQKPNRVAVPFSVLDGMELTPGDEFFIIIQKPATGGQK